MNQLSSVNVVFCEDVRREASGASTIIGATLASKPLPLEKPAVAEDFCFYIESQVSGGSALCARLVHQESRKVAFNEVVDMPDFPEIPDNVEKMTVNMITVLKPSEVIFEHGGVYELQLCLDESEWTTYKQILVQDDESIVNLQA